VRVGWGGGSLRWRRRAQLGGALQSFKSWPWRPAGCCCSWERKLLQLVSLGTPRAQELVLACLQNLTAVMPAAADDGGSVGLAPTSSSSATARDAAEPRRWSRRWERRKRTGPGGRSARGWCRALCSATRRPRPRSGRRAEVWQPPTSRSALSRDEIESKGKVEGLHWPF